MGARHKLNQTHILGALGVAAVVGGLAGSWTVFFLVAVVLVGASVYVGDVRIHGGPRH